RLYPRLADSATVRWQEGVRRGVLWDWQNVWRDHGQQSSERRGRRVPGGNRCRSVFHRRQRGRLRPPQMVLPARPRVLVPAIVPQERLCAIARRLFLSLNPQLQELPGWLRIDDDLGEFRPLAFLVNPQHGTGSDVTQREAPGEALPILQELDVRLEKAAIVEGAHVISSRLIVEGDNPERLENGLVVRPGSSDPLNFQNQPIQLELSLFSLRQNERLARATLHTSVSGPFADQKRQLPHRRSLRVQIRRSRELCHA